MARFKGVNKYSGLARDVIKELDKSDDNEILYKFAKTLCKYAEQSPSHYIIPIVDLPQEIKESKIAKHKKKYDKQNIGFRFTKNCIISNKCNKKCYRYEICKAEYEKELEDEDE